MRLILLLLLLPCIVNAQKMPLDYVDPNIGSVHSRWFFYTPAAHPFGMAKPAPSTNGQYGNKWGWEAVGYDGTHTSIEGFVNFHEFQVGGVSLMPTTGKLVTVPGKLDEEDTGYRSRFKKENEVAQPGYYSVFLDDYKVRAELTSTERVAFHRYTFDQNEEGNILFDIGNTQGESGAVVDASVRITKDNKVEGFVITHPGYAKYYQPGSYVKMYFVAELNQLPISVDAFNKETIHKGERSSIGKGAGLALKFNTSTKKDVEVKIGLSYTSIENAALNLSTEASTLNFDQAKEKAQNEWSEKLGRIAVKGGSEEHLTKFYTALYHAILGRGVESDVNGNYPSINGGIGQIPLDKEGKPTYNHYNTDAVWGAFWNLTQLWALVYPDYYNQFIQCQLDIYKDGGWLADGVATNKYVSGVGTNYMGLVIASAYNRGIRDFDVETAYKAVYKNEMGWMNRPLGAGKADTKVWVEKGYVPLTSNEEYYSASNADGSQFSASHTLEYSFSAYAAAQMAKALGKNEDYEMFMERAKGWEKLFDSSTGFIRPKLPNGEFVEEFDPKKVWTGFQEGNAWQYTFYVPHDAKGLIKKIGEEEFNKRLDSVFETAAITKFGGGETVDAFAGLENVYNHGNQPSLHIAWLYNYANQPEKTQYWVREICNVFYGTDQTHGYGYGQDEDQGQLGAWYVLAGIGLFDVEGGAGATPTLQMALPQFEEITIRLDQKFYAGKELKILTKGNPTAHHYIKSAKWNGEKLPNVFLPWSEIIEGGVLEIKSSAKSK
ncbi:GH92 family glycosyl hydrolase [Flammeovirga pectinis]|nr:GH92 family glycosyl hydrolase [Flammeovirga pectinis]